MSAAEAELAAPASPLAPLPSEPVQTAPSAEGDDEIELQLPEGSNKSPDYSVASEEDADASPGRKPQTRANSAGGRRASQVDVMQELTDAYAKDANPNAETIAALVQRTGLSENQVINFFANKRARDRAAEAKADVASAPAAPAPSSLVDESLAQITNEDGGLAEPENAVQLVKLMQTPQIGIDDQFLILAVILATKSFQCRKRFLELGGLPPICDWLSAAKRDNKVPLQRELLRVLECLPIKVELLRATTAGKVVKGLKASSDPDIKLRADRLVSAWMSLVAAIDPATAAQPSAVNTSSDAVPTTNKQPEAPDAAKKRVAPQQPPSVPAPKSAASVAKKPRLEDSSTPQSTSSTAAPAKKAPSAAPTAAPVVAKAKPEPPKPKVVAASTTLATNDDFDILAKKKSIVPDHLKKPARASLLIEGDEKKKEEARPKDATFTSKPISADEIRKEKLRQKALGVDKVEPKLESKPGQGAAVAAQLGKIVAAVTSGSLTSADPPLPVIPSSVATLPAPFPVSAPAAAAAPPLVAPPSVAPPAVPVEEVPLGKNGKPKKRLVWSDAKGLPLKKVKTFVKDKQDLIDLHNNKDFNKAAHMEHQREKENLLKEKQMHTVDLKVTVAWRRPRPLQLPVVQPVQETAEAKAQNERERSILIDMQPFKADRTIDMSKVRESPLEADAGEPQNDDTHAVPIPWADEPLVQPAAAAAALPQLLSLSNFANLQSVFSQMPAVQPPPPVPQPVMPPNVDPSFLVQALASLVQGGAPLPPVPQSVQMPYYPPQPGGFTNYPPSGPVPPVGQFSGGSRDNRDARDNRESRDRDRDITPEQLAARRHILCQYFLKGDCKYGARCHFSHNPTEEDLKNAKRKRGGGR